MSILKTNNSGMVQYFLCHNNNDIYHPVKLQPGDTLETGQPYVDEITQSEYKELVQDE